MDLELEAIYSFLPTMLFVALGLGENDTAHYWVWKGVGRSPSWTDGDKTLTGKVEIVKQ